MRLSPTMVPIHLQIGSGAVELVDMPGERFGASFLSATVWDHDHRDPPSARGRARLEEYLDATEPTGRAPDGLLTTVGRSGSSLLANLLGCRAATLVLKEAQPVAEVAHHLVWAHAVRNGRPLGPHTPRDVRTRSCDEVDELGRRMLRSLFRPTNGQTGFVIKTSWLESANLGRLTSLFSPIPTIFVTRAVEEVVASYLHRPPNWIHGLLERPAGDLAALLPSLASEPPDDSVDQLTFFANLWISASQAASPDALRIDHADLVREPVPTAERAAVHLGLPFAPSERSCLNETAHRDAKPQLGERPGAARSRPSAPPLTTAQADRVAELVDAAR